MYFYNTLIEKMRSIQISDYLQVTYDVNHQYIHLDCMSGWCSMKIYNGMVYFGVFNKYLYSNEKELMHDFDWWLDEGVITAGKIYSSWNNAGRLVDIDEYANNKFNIRYSIAEANELKKTIKQLDAYYSISPEQTEINDFLAGFDPFVDLDFKLVNKNNDKVWRLIKDEEHYI